MKPCNWLSVDTNVGTISYAALVKLNFGGWSLHGDCSKWSPGYILAPVAFDTFFFFFLYQRLFVSWSFVDAVISGDCVSEDLVIRSCTHYRYCYISSCGKTFFKRKLYDLMNCNRFILIWFSSTYEDCDLRLQFFFFFFNIALYFLMYQPMQLEVLYKRTIQEIF